MTGDTQSPESPTRRLAFLDALRGAAATWVVLFHFGEGGQIATLRAALPSWLDQSIFEAGHFGVPVFFVLSGFVIAHSIGDDHVTPRYFGRFALRRAIRLDIPYWASIAVVLAFVALKRLVLPATTLASAAPGNVLAHMFYLQEFLGLQPINPVYWTLTYEVQFYLLFCVLLGVTHALRQTPGDRRPEAAVFTLAAIVAIAWPLIPALHARGVALVTWYSFLLGAFASWTLSGRLKPRWFGLFAAALLVMWSSTHDAFAMACLATAVLIYIAGRAGKLSGWCNSRLPQFLGKISYSLYLVHVPVSGAAFYLLSRLHGETVWNDLLAAVIVLVINCVAAWCFWWLAERPSMALARRLRKR